MEIFLTICDILFVCSSIVPPDIEFITIFIYWSFFLDSDGNRDQVCDGYIEYFKHKRSLHNKVKELKGKVLGCHCAPLKCHGDYLKQLTNEN